MNQYSIGASRFAAPALAPGLHIVSTPIGNLRDVTLRALETLATAALVLCEDKRVSRVLLDHYGITTALKSYHEHNAAERRPEILKRLSAGEAIALISDAGTPLVSDPGFRLVSEALAAGFSVFPVPGPSAVLAALVATGLPSDRFFFEGFLPVKSAERRRRLRTLETIPGTLVFYEAPHRLPEMLADLAAVFPERGGAVARELTKRFETVRRGPIAALASTFATDEESARGEIAVLLEPPGEDATTLGDDAIDAALAEAMQTVSAKDAAALVAGRLGLPRRQVYARAIALSAGARSAD